MKSVRFRNGRPAICSSGTTMAGDSGLTSMVSPPSQSCPTSFIATQQPLKRDSAIACSPSSRNSPTDAG